MKSKLAVSKKILEQIAVATMTNNEFVGLVVIDELISITLKDLNDSFFYDNFESEYTYSSMEDNLRISNFDISTSSGRTSIGSQIQSYKDFTDLKNENRLTDDYLDRYSDLAKYLIVTQ